jgi:thymidine phosphorylase
MMSGRGLSHTGGTLDKLEAIPGFRTRLSLEEMRRVLRDTRCVMIGQTDEIAPADRRLYALRRHRHGRAFRSSARRSKQEDRRRDRALVLDVKVGAARSRKPKRTRARSPSGCAGLRPVTASRRGPADVHGGPARADRGNANEVIESIETLKGKGPRMWRACPSVWRRGCSSVRASRRTMGTRSVGADGAHERRRAGGISCDGRRAGRRSQGRGRLYRLPSVRHREPWVAPGPVVGRMDAELVGRAAVALGAGRDRADAAVDPAVGIDIVAPVGAKVQAKDPVLMICCAAPDRVAAARALLDRAIDITAAPPVSRPLVIGTVK